MIACMVSTARMASSAYPIATGPFADSRCAITLKARAGDAADITKARQAAGLSMNQSLVHHRPTLSGLARATSEETFTLAWAVALYLACAMSKLA